MVPGKAEPNTRQGRLPTGRTRAADPGRVGQHGLEIVQAVTESLFMEQEPLGKRITARINLSGAPDMSF